MTWLTGYPREKVNWGPTIDPQKCVNCGMCMNCGEKVFAWKDKKAVVAHYFECVVGCTTCGNLCLGRAISFPDLTEIRELYKREGIWNKVKRQLKEEGKIS